MALPRTILAAAAALAALLAVQPFADAGEKHKRRYEEAKARRKRLQELKERIFPRRQPPDPLHIFRDALEKRRKLLTLPLLTKKEAQTYEPLRWTWEQWWQANRDPYLKPAGAEPTGSDDELGRDLQSRAVADLQAALKSKTPAVRAQAALALGRMGAATAFNAAAELIGDKHLEVRRAAMIAVALMDHERSVQLLIDVEPRLTTPEDRHAVLMGLALVSNVDTRTLDVIRQVVNKPVGKTSVSFRQFALSKIPMTSTHWPNTSPEENRQILHATWALRRHQAMGPDEIIERLHHMPTPVLVSQTMLFLTDWPANERSLQVLRHVLLATDEARQLRVRKHLHSTNFERRRRLGKILEAEQGKIKKDNFDRYKRVAYEHDALVDHDRSSDYPPGQRKRLRRGVVGVEAIYKSRLRASAAIALGRTQHQHAGPILLEIMDDKDDAHSELYKGFALISLAAIPDTDQATTLSLLLDTYSRTTHGGRRRKSHKQHQSPLRGHAALALGLYARNAEKHDGPTDQSFTHKIGEALAGGLFDPKETDEVRQASALALGLTGDQRNLAPLRKAGDQRKADAKLVGYILLGRAMLGDQSIVIPAKNLLATRLDEDDPQSLTTHRNAILSLGLSRAPQAADVLLRIRPDDRHIANELALALALTGDTRVAVPLLQTLTEGRDARLRASAATCLGWLFAKERPWQPPRLARFINQTNYTIPNHALRPYQAYHNDFVFSLITDSDEHPWW